MEIERERRSPHFKPRPKGVLPDLVILHASVGKSDVGDLSWMCDAQSKVSYHYLVGRDGTIYELVDPKHQAWHAGDSQWKGRKFCNAFSIGVAWSNLHNGSEALTGAQLTAMRNLLGWLSERFPTLAEVVTHRDVSPGRKSDPEGCPNFHKPDWCGPLAP